MLKKAKVVMLPTNEKAPINLTNQGLLFNSPDYIGKNQHLYITSDDEIEEGDWCVDTIDNNYIFKINKTFIKDNPNYKNYCKKIIATTDSSLKINNPNYNIGELAYINLPQPSQAFIKKYVEEYNKGNIITDVLVEYDVITLNEDWSKNPVVVTNEYKLKISKDNTITINKVKDSWSREEIEKLIYQYSSEVYGIKSKPALTIKWIEENL